MTSQSLTDQTQPARVHLVDDDASVRAAVEDLLASVGLSTRSYVSAADFLDRARLDEPGCLVLDVRMPGMNGLDLQQELQRRGLALPIIFITGHGDIPMSVRAMKQGALEFLTKPFRDQDLLDAITRRCARRRTPMPSAGSCRTCRPASTLSTRANGRCWRGW